MATLQKRQDSTARSGTAKAQPTPATGAGGPTVEMIAARAYEIWQANGCPTGSDAENWYQAERELRERARK